MNLTCTTREAFVNVFGVTKCKTGSRYFLTGVDLARSGMVEGVGLHKDMLLKFLMGFRNS
jgi:hypothetical protein